MISDGGVEPDGSVAGGGTLVVGLAGDVDSLEDDVTLEALTLRVASLRARGDRGGDFDPQLEGPLALDLTGGAATRRLDAAPATYSALALRLESGGGQPAFMMRVRELGMPAIEVVDQSAIDLDLRCSGPGVLDPGGEIRLLASLKLGELHGELRSSSLPAPVDGVIHVDETTAPAILTALRALLREHWEVLCGEDDGPGGT